MRNKKSETPKVKVEEEGAYWCPECGGINYLDSYEFTKLTHNGKMNINCPMCKTKIKLYAYEPDNYPEL